MTTYNTNCDMGAVKIFNDTMACFFDNHVGDCTTKVRIMKGTPKKYTEFPGHFTVKTKAYLSDYDCSDVPIHTFNSGRYFVYLIDAAYIAICKEDDELNS